MLWAVASLLPPKSTEAKPLSQPSAELNIGTSTEVKLANGMTLIVVENHKTPSVTGA